MQETTSAITAGTGRPLVLIGGGGHCRSVIDAAESAGYTVKAVLDPALPAGSDVSGIPVAGNDDLIEQYAADCDFIITVGAIKNFGLRRKLYRQVLACNGRLATVVASTARVSPRARLGSGTVVLHGACVNTCADIGENCIINTLACVEHDSVIGAQSHISTGAVVNGGCRIGDEVFVGSNAVVCNGVSVASGTIIGAASFVAKSIEMPGTYAELPAKRMF